MLFQQKRNAAINHQITAFPVRFNLVKLIQDVDLTGCLINEPHITVQLISC